MFSRRAFSVAGQVAWNSLPDYPGETGHVPLTVFAGPENFSFLVLLAYTAHWGHCDYALYNVNVNVNVAFNVTLHEQVRYTEASYSIKSYSLSHSWTLR